MDEDPEEELDEPEEEEELEEVEPDEVLEVEEVEQLAGNFVNVNAFLVFFPILSVTETVNEFVLAGCESEIVNVPFCDRLL